SPELHNGAVPTPICRDDVRALFLVVALNGRFIGVTAVNRDRFGDTMAMDRFLQKAQCGLCIAVLREQKVDRLAVFVDGAIQILALQNCSCNRTSFGGGANWRAAPGGITSTRGLLDLWHPCAGVHGTPRARQSCGSRVHTPRAPDAAWAGCGPRCVAGRLLTKAARTPYRAYMHL